MRNSHIQAAGIKRKMRLSQKYRALRQKTVRLPTSHNCGNRLRVMM